MPKIRDLAEQKQALREIEALLSEIENINGFLKLENFSGEYEISFTTVETVVKDEKTKEKKVRNSAPFLCRDRETVNRFVYACKQEKREKIKELSELYNIELDEKELEIIQ